MFDKLKSLIDPGSLIIGISIGYILRGPIKLAVEVVTALLKL
jgi:hypothetical protein